MPLITKPNYDQIFATQAPDQDKPAEFNNYPRGWDESRKNNGKPTIKQFNFLQQKSDLKALWILQNGACLPYDENSEYAIGAPVLKDGIIQQKTSDGFKPVATEETPYLLKFYKEDVSYPLHARIMLTNGDIVQSTIPSNSNNPNSNMSGWIKPTVSANSVIDNSGMKQQDINNSSFITVNSLSDLISISNPENNKIINVLSFFDGKGKGGDLFKWSSDTSKSLHDGGYIIDPLIGIPALSSFNTYYTPLNTENGVWVRLNNNQDVLAENYGLVKSTDDPTAVWSCAAIQQAIKKASVQSTTDYYCKTVKVGKGRYFTTNPIVLSTNGSFSARLPALIGGDGGTIYGAELVKTTSNTVGSGYIGGDIDAVIFVSPTTARGDYVYGENTRGFTLSRSAIDVGYGYYAIKSVMCYRGEIQAIGHGNGIYTDDCWMSKVGFLRAYQGLNGISVRGGTSTFGAPLYVDSAKNNGYDFYGLTYSNLNCACDGVGSGLVDGGIAYDLSFAKGVSGVFAVERHKGIEFYLHYTECGEIKGRSYHTTPVATSAYKVFVNGGSVADFSNFTWKDTYANTGSMTPSEITKYSFSNKANYTSSINFGGIQNDSFASYGLVAQLDSKFAGNVLDAAYSNNCGVVTHILSLNNTTFKRLCFVGKSASIELLSASCMNASLDRYYANPFVITEGAPNVIANVRPNRILKSSISTISTSPTNIYQLYNASVAISAYLQAYIDPQGWLCVRSSNTGNNADYKFVIVT